MTTTTPDTWQPANTDYAKRELLDIMRNEPFAELREWARQKLIGLGIDPETGEDPFEGLD